MIREAVLADIPALVAMGREFHGAAGWGDITSFSDEDCAQTLSNMIASDDAIIMVADRDGEIIGMSGGVTTPIYFNYGHKTGQELFFWMRPDARNGEGARLLAALEDAARAKGCQSWAMIALDKIRPEATGALYRRRGYRPAEHSWIKRLTDGN